MSLPATRLSPRCTGRRSRRSAGRRAPRKIRPAAALSRTRPAAETYRPRRAGRSMRPYARRCSRPMSGSTRRKYQRYSALTPGMRGMPNSRIASRPPGRSTRAISAQPTSAFCTLRMPKATVTASALPSAAGSRIASPRTSAIRRLLPAAAHLVQPDAPASRRRSRRRAPRRRAGRRPRAPRPRCRADVDQRLAAGQPQRRDRLRPPPPVDAGAEQLVQQVVPRRDRIEHPGDAIGSLVGSLAHSFALTTKSTKDIEDHEEYLQDEFCFRGLRSLRGFVVRFIRCTGQARWPRSRRCRRSRSDRTPSSPATDRGR